MVFLFFSFLFLQSNSYCCSYLQIQRFTDIKPTYSYTIIKQKMSILLTFEPFSKHGKHVIPGTCLLFTMIKECTLQPTLRSMRHKINRQLMLSYIALRYVVFTLQPIYDNLLKHCWIKSGQHSSFFYLHFIVILTSHGLSESVL